MAERDGGSLHTTVGTRLSPPRLRSELVERQRLVAQLLGSTGGTIVVTGPAGSGKSTLLAQAYAREHDAAWVSIDPDDNDPAVLWSTLTVAIAKAIDGFGASYERELAAQQVDVLGRVVPAAINELAESGLPLTLFLDDIHLINNLLCQRSLETFVEQRPERVTVVIAGRTPPPFRLRRQQLHGKLIEIGHDELQLSADETRALLGALDLHLDDVELGQLMDRTEGWTAGIRWAAMALENDPDLSRFLDSAAALDGEIGRYLVEEVLGQQSGPQRMFMLETSVLTHLSADLCDAVRGRQDSGLRLEELERANAMVVGTARGDGWYRYHHLVREVLESRLQREWPGRAVDLHRRAAQRLFEDGAVTQAVHHALAAGERIDAANMLCASWWDLMNKGRLDTAMMLLGLFEEGEIRAHQPLAAAAAFLFGLAGDDVRSSYYYRVAHEGDFDGKPPDGSASMESTLAILRASMSFEGVAQTLADSELAYSLEPATSRWRPLLALINGLGRVWIGDSASAAAYLEEVVIADTENDAAGVYALAELALARLDQGDVEGARSAAESACDRVDEAGLDHLFVSATAHGAAAMTHLALGRKDAASEHLMAATAPMQEVGRAMPLDAMRTRLLLADVAIKLDSTDLALGYLDGAAVNQDGIADTGVLAARLVDLRKQLDSDGAQDLGLSPRECELVPLLPTHLTNRQLASELHVSLNTVKSHLRSIYRKLGVTTRDEAVARCRELGLI